MLCNSIFAHVRPQAPGRLSLVLTTILFACSSSTLAQHYNVIDLGSLSGPVSQAFDVNASGHVVGTAFATPGGEEMHAFRWNGSTMTDLGTLGNDPHSVAFAINDAGNVVGVSYELGELHPRAFRWQNGTISNIGTFTPRDINTTGDIVGSRSVASGNAGLAWQDRACILANGSLVSLGTLGGGNSYAMSLNDGGEVVGSSQIAGDQTSHAFYWNGGSLVDLGTLGGAMSQAYAINASRTVVGVSETASGQMRAFRYSLNASGNVTQRVDLHDLGGGGSCAYALNNSGLIVGASNGHAVIWRGTSLIDLNTRIPAHSGWVLDAATSISSTGSIVGFGRHDGIPHAFMLVPNVSAAALTVTASRGQFNGRTLLKWESYDGAADYQVQRKLIPGGSYEVIADHVAERRLNDRDTTKCQRYRYRVRVRSATGAFLTVSGSDVGWRGTCANLLLRVAPDIAGNDAPTSAPERAADLNGDGCVDAADLLAMTGVLGSCERCAADLDGDGRVDAMDVSLLLTEWDSARQP